VLACGDGADLLSLFGLGGLFLRLGVLLLRLVGARDVEFSLHFDLGQLALHLGGKRKSVLLTRFRTVERLGNWAFGCPPCLSFSHWR